MCYTLEEPAAPVLEEPEEPAPKKPHPVVALRELSASWRSLLLLFWRSLRILLRRSQILVPVTPHPPSMWSLECHECRKCVVYNCSQCVDIGVVLLSPIHWLEEFQRQPCPHSIVTSLQPWSLVMMKHHYIFVQQAARIGSLYIHDICMTTHLHDHSPALQGHMSRMS